MSKASVNLSMNGLLILVKKFKGAVVVFISGCIVVLSRGTAT